MRFLRSLLSSLLFCGIYDLYPCSYDLHQPRLPSDNNHLVHIALMILCMVHDRYSYWYDDENPDDDKEDQRFRKRRRKRKGEEEVLCFLLSQQDKNQEESNVPSQRTCQAG